MSDAYEYGELLVVQHQADCGPAALRPTLEGRAARRPWRLVDLGAGEPVPELDPGVRGLLVLGGGMGVPDPEPVPWLDAELALLREAHGRGVPVFGICLGAQLVAAALGGRVERRDTPQVGYVSLGRTPQGAEDVVFAGWPDGGPGLFAHEDGIVELPEGAALLLEGSLGLDAFRVGTSYGVQFHPEATAGSVASWLDDPEFDEIVRTAGVESEAFLAEIRDRERFHLAVGISLVGRWIDGVVGADDPTPRKHRR